MSPRLLERLALAALFLLALVPRARDIGSGFDREFDGYQGAFFAIAAVNYERLGVRAAGGYPVLNIDLPGGSPESARERTENWFVYQNHPPTTALLGWGAMKLLGPSGWSDAWRKDASPAGVEAPLRFPFLLFHLAALLALWWLARIAFGRQVALIALALTAYLPVSALYGTLVNMENPSLPCVLLAVGSYGLYVRNGRKRALFGMGAALAIGCCVTFAPAFFLPPLVLRSLWTRRPREAALVFVCGSVACALPVFLHSVWSQWVLVDLHQTPITLIGRAQVLFAPLLDGSIPLFEWLATQIAHARHCLGGALALLATGGLLLCVLRAVSKSWNSKLAAGEWPRNEHEDIDLATPMALGAAALLFGFYKHTSEEQWSFWLYVAPAAALLAARALHMLSFALQRLRGGVAPLVLLVGTVMMTGLVQFESWRATARAPGPHDVEGLATGPDAPLPSTAGAGIAEVLPPGALGLHPSSLGLNLAANWYAWRSLLPVSSLHDPTQEFVVERFGLQEAPRFLVIPVEVPESAQAEVMALTFGMEEPTTSSDTWRAWRQ